MTKPAKTRALLALFLSLSASCSGVLDAGGDTGTAGRDGGARMDAGGVGDGSATGDTGGATGDTGGATDTGIITPTPDTGTVGDAGAIEDAATASDAATATDAASSADGGAVGTTIPVGHCGALRGRYFPESTWIYTDIHDAPTRGTSSATTAWLGSRGGWGTAGHFQYDNSFYIVDGNSSSPTYPNSIGAGDYFAPDCDPGVLFPVPAGGHIEGVSGYLCGTSGDCHLLVADFGARRLFESYQANFASGTYVSSCDLVWDMTADVWGSPPAAGAPMPDPSVRNYGIGQGCTGPDAAGFPIAPLLITIGDVMSGRVEHVMRFALPNDRIQRSAVTGGPGPTWVWPATHAGGPTAVDPSAPIYGGRWRLHDPFDIAAHGMDPTNPVVQAVVYGLQHYGMVLADGGNVPIMVEDASDCGTTWDDINPDGSHALYGILPSDFDVLETGLPGDGYDCVPNTAR